MNRLFVFGIILIAVSAICFDWCISQIAYTKVPPLIFGAVYLPAIIILLIGAILFGFSLENKDAVKFGVP